MVNYGSPHQFFEDPHPPVLPASLIPHSWKRPHQLKNIEAVLYVPSSKPPNLFINNKHLLHCQFIKWFISSITILYYHGKEGLEITESPNFLWKFKNKSWKGWYYIYSLNKMERKSQHIPLINSYGKYIVRLFFWGTWRSIEIDDLIPVDQEENPFLPRTENNQELWPMLLAKAMLKIVSMTWASSTEIKNMEMTNRSININLIYLLTGWTCLSLDISHLFPSDRWELLLKYVEKYTQSNTLLREEIAVEKNNKALKVSVEDNRKGKKIRRESKGSTTSAETSKKEEEEKKRMNDSSVLTLLLLKNIENGSEENEIPFDYPIYVELISDIHLDPTKAKPPLDNWKLHRWFSWATSQGIINPLDYLIPTRLILLFLRHYQHQSYSQDHEKNLNQFLEWFDFNELSKYPMEIFFLFKTNKFKCSINISDTFGDHLSQQKNNKNSLKKYYQYFHQSINERNRTKNSRNEPLYFLIDSVRPKFVIFNFNVIPDVKRPSLLIVEKYCWFRRILEEQPLLKIKTTISSSKILSLDPGRHLLRIFVQSMNSYHLSIESDTIFEVGNREEMHKLMASESEMSKKFVENVKNCLISTLEAFGTESYSKNLKNYYQSYFPEHKLLESHKKPYEMDKKMSQLIHQFFKESLIDFVKKKCLENDLKNILQALRIFFIDPTIGRSNLYSSEEIINDNQFNFTLIPSIEDIYKKMGEEENIYLNSINNNSTEIKAAVIIQSFWRMFRIKLYKKIHTFNSNEGRKEEIKKSLELINTILKQNSIYELVRNFIEKNHELSYLYPLSTDSPYVLNVKKIEGKISNHFHEWLPMFRLTVNVPENSIVFASLDLFIDLPVQFLRVFNNDTGQEVQRIINGVLPYHYSRGNRGYTIFGYGWTDNNLNRDDNDNYINQKKEIAWTLHITSMKGDCQFIFVNKDGEEKPISSLGEVPNVKIDEISNNYLPNVFNKIFKAVIKTSKSCLIALRVAVSYKKVLMKIKLIDKEEKLLKEVSGRSGIVVPIVYLNNSDLNYIEVSVIENSWPLTKKEWNTVLNIKERRLYKHENVRKINEEINNLTNKSDFSAKDNKSKKKEVKENGKNVLEAPYWVLQVVSDIGDVVEVCEDTSREEEITKLKELWFSNDSGRLERGKVMRKAFLEKFHSTNKEDTLEVIEDMIDENIRTMKPP